MDVSSEPSSPVATSRWRSAAIGCAALLVLCVLFIALLYYWAVTPGPQVPSGSFLGPQTMGVAELQGLRDDPAVQAMTGAMMRRMSEAQRGQLEQSEVPAIFRWLAGDPGEIGEGEIDKALSGAPRDAVVQLEAVPGSPNPQFLVVVNLNRYSRAFRFAYRLGSWMQGEEEVAGCPVFRMGEQGPLFLVFLEDTLLCAESRDVLRLVLERRREGGEAGPSSNVLATFASRQERWNLFGTVENREGSLAWIADRLRERWPGIPPRPELDAILERVHQIDFGLDVADENSLEGFFDLVCRSPGEAGEIAGLLGALVELSGSDPHFALAVESSEERVRVFLHFSDFVQFAVDSIQPEPEAENTR